MLAFVRGSERGIAPEPKYAQASIARQVALPEASASEVDGPPVRKDIHKYSRRNTFPVTMGGRSMSAPDTGRARLSLSAVRSALNEAHERALSHIPTPVGEHLTAARKELLSAARAVIDEEIRWTEAHWRNAKAMKAERRAPEREAEPASTDEADDEV